MLALSLPALAFCMACAVAYSGSDYFRKAVPGTCGAPLVLFYMVSGQIPVLALWLWLSGEFRVSVSYVAPGAAAAVIGLAANLLFISAVRRSPLSLMIPMLGAIPVVTVASGGLIAGEWPTWRQSAGILLVAMGLAVLYAPARGSVSFGAFWRNMWREPGAKPMAGVVVLWSMAPPLDKICIGHSSVGLHGVIQLTLLWSASALWILATQGRRTFAVPRSAARLLLGAAATAGFAYGFQLAAYQITLVAVVELFKRAIGMGGSLVLGRVMFGELVTASKLLGVALMAFGLPFVILA